MLSLITAFFTGIVLTAACLLVSYLLLLLIAAATAKKPNFPTPEILPFLCVVIPAHNEEMVIAATLKSLQAQNYPSHCYAVVVIADNCTDRTAAIVREMGEVVLERLNRVEKGKGYALAWAFDLLLQEGGQGAGSSAKAFCILDADTWAEPNFLRAMASRFAAGQTAIQARYGVLNATESWRSSLMSGAFDLVNHLRLWGADRLGLFVGLKGNGMLFSRSVLQKTRWSGHSITEDLDYSLDLIVKQGTPVRYAPEIRVNAQMPTTANQAASQRSRWEGGRYRIIRERFAEVLKLGVQKRNGRLLDAAFGFIVPPLSELAALIMLGVFMVTAGVSLSLLAVPLYWICIAGFCVAGFLLYVLAGFAVSGARKEVYFALLCAPFYALWKFALYGQKKNKPRVPAMEGATTAPEWIRTARAPITVSNETVTTEEAKK